MLTEMQMNSQRKLRRFSSILAIFCSIIFGSLVSSCATKAKPEFESPSFDAVQFDQQKSQGYAPSFKEETFKVGDQVKVSVNGLDEFSGIYTVGNDGNILLGHIGSVTVENVTITNLQEELHARYKACCLVKPNVSIERDGQIFGKIVVDGAVNDPGVFETDSLIKLSEAIALAGGITEIANTDEIILTREIDGELKRSIIRLADIREFGANNPFIYPNDVIFVQDSEGRILYQDFVKTIPIISAVILATTR